MKTGQVSARAHAFDSFGSLVVGDKGRGVQVHTHMVLRRRRVVPGVVVPPVRNEVKSEVKDFRGYLRPEMALKMPILLSFHGHFTSFSISSRRERGRKKGRQRGAHMITPFSGSYSSSPA